MTTSHAIAALTCPVCGHESHNLKPHFKDAGGPCPLTRQEFEDAHPGHPLTTPLFEQKLAELRAKKAQVDGFTRRVFDVSATFGFDLPNPMTVTGFVERSPMVPDIDPGYRFPMEETMMILLGLETNRPVMLHGPTGSGKSSLIEQVAARINYPVMRVSHHADMYSMDIVGQMTVKNGATAFQYGPLPTAMRQAVVFIADEWDAMNPETALQYQAVLERKPDGSALGNLILTANDSERVESHPHFRIVATSNTCGLGDMTGHYQGTQHQNLAFVSRFLLRVYQGYQSQDTEKKVLQQKLPYLTVKECDSFTETARKIRDRYEAGELPVPFSLRDLLNWAELAYILGNPTKAMEMACTSILPPPDKQVITEIIQRVFGSSSTDLNAK